MKGYNSCLFDTENHEIPEQTEKAHILAHIYSSLCGDFIKNNRSRRIGFLVMGIAGIIILIVSLIAGWGAAGIVIGLIIGGIGFGIFASVFQKKPNAKVLAFGKAYWVGAFENFEGGQLLLDKSQLTAPTNFIVPVPGIKPGELVAATVASQQALNSPPILASRKTAGKPGTKESQTVNQDPTQTIQEQLSLVADGLAGYKTEQVSLPVLTSNMNLTRAIINDVNSAPNADIKNPIIGPNAWETKNRLQNLGKLTGIIRDKAEQTGSIEELAQQVVNSLEANVKTLDNMRRVSLIEVLNQTLGRLENAYQAPMLLYYCPECLKNAANETKLDLDKINRGIQIEDPNISKEIFVDKLTESLSDTVELFITTSRAAIMKLELVRLVNSEKWQWECPQGHLYPIGDKRIYVAYRAKQELVMPLWDQLWMELSVERAGLHERKDKEQRDNIQSEHRDTVGAIETFGAERREIKNRIEGLRSSTIKSVETFNELISSFIQSGIVAPQQIASESSDAKRFREEYLNTLSEIDKKITTIEDELRVKREESLTRRGPVMEAVDTIKVNSQFMEPASPVKEITIL